MKRTVSIVAATSQAAADVRLDASRTLADVLPQLVQLTGSDLRRVVRNGIPLDPGLPVSTLRDGDVLVLTDTDSPAAPSHLIRIEVTAGPDAGLSAELPAGRWLLGRHTEVLPATDPQMSREHLELVVAADGTVEVTDLHATNGTRLDDAPLTAGQRVQWPAGTTLRCGATHLVHGRRAAAAATALGVDGTTIVNRPPRLDGADRPQAVVFPAAPGAVSPSRLPLL